MGFIREFVTKAEDVAKKKAYCSVTKFTPTQCTSNVLFKKHYTHTHSGELWGINMLNIVDCSDEDVHNAA